MVLLGQHLLAQCVEGGTLPGRDTSIDEPSAILMISAVGYKWGTTVAQGLRQDNMKNHTTKDGERGGEGER